MSRIQRIFLYCLLIFFLVINISCSGEEPVRFAVNGTDAVLYGNCRDAQEGTLDFSKPQKLEYRFSGGFAVLPNSSLQIEYEFSAVLPQTIKENYSLVLNTGAASWQLPMDADAIYSYAIPVEETFSGNFTIALESVAANVKIDKNSAPVFIINSVNFTNRFFGFYFAESDVAHIFTGPFISRQGSEYIIDVPSAFWPNPAYAGINSSFSAGGAVLQLAGRRLETFPDVTNIFISPALNLPQGYAVLTAEEVTSFLLFPSQEIVIFPAPIAADPALVIEWPRENWRNAGYEVFKWDRFTGGSAPTILIFDYADYAAQDRMLKRLAFFVEKAGFRGRLAHDREIAHLHGWNAHDYRAEDLARFFDLASKTDFPLLDEERQLENILLKEGIICETADGIASGAGAIISISRGSPDYLRWRFMAHEGFHGLYFIDEDFRDFCRRRWEQFPPAAKRFLTSFFEFQQYDITDEYLLLNEFMAHVLQQPVSAAADYFGRQLPQRLESTWRSSHLPQKDSASDTWPELAAAFTAEAQAFSDYVNRRWGMAAGRVWGMRVR